MRAKTRVHNSRSQRPSAARRARLNPRKEPRQERSRATVEVILAAATRVLCKHGYDGATTNQIAEQAGVSVGSLYQYFPNKEAIVGALIERHDDEMWDVFAAGAALSAGRPIVEVAPLIIAAVFEAHLVEPELHRVLHETVPRVGKLARLRETNERARAMVVELLRARRDEIDVQDVDVAAFVIVEAVEALIHQSVELDAAGAAAVRREATTLVLRYLRVGN
jgi:AcrR family transcriptional regulator